MEYIQHKAYDCGFDSPLPVTLFEEERAYGICKGKLGSLTMKSEKYKEALFYQRVK